jgi:cytochrome b involved in lipid metabolism
MPPQMQQMGMPQEQMAFPQQDPFGQQQQQFGGFAQQQQDPFGAFGQQQPQPQFQQQFMEANVDSEAEIDSALSADEEQLEFHHKKKKKRQQQPNIAALLAQQQAANAAAQQNAFNSGLAHGRASVAPIQQTVIQPINIPTPMIAPQPFNPQPQQSGFQPAPIIINPINPFQAQLPVAPPQQFMPTTQPINPYAIGPQPTYYTYQPSQPQQPYQQPQPPVNPQQPIQPFVNPSVITPTNPSPIQTAVGGLPSLRYVQTFTSNDHADAANLARHNIATDCYIQYFDYIYDVTLWINSHPGGREAFTSSCGTDGTAVYVRGPHGIRNDRSNMLRARGVRVVAPAAFMTPLTEQALKNMNAANPYNLGVIIPNNANNNNPNESSSFWDTNKWIIIGCCAGGGFLLLIILVWACAKYCRNKDEITTQNYYKYPAEGEGSGQLTVSGY